MAQLSLTTAEPTLAVKLVYYGPALSGKTTNLIKLHDGLKPAIKGDVEILQTGNDRTLFFDAFPLGFRAPSGLLMKLKVFTVPGQVAHDSTRKAVLSRADGVVFVADSQRRESTNNEESFSSLLTNLRWLGRDPDSFPITIQFNKRDLTDIVSEQELKSRWARTAWPDLCFASALTGAGVIDSFQAALRRTHAIIDKEYHIARNHGLSSDLLAKLALGIE